MKTLLFIATGLMAASVMAASSGFDNLLISGTVESLNTLVVTANAPNNTTLPILAGSVAAINVGKATETSNNSTGYKITMSSVNGSKLINGLNATTSANVISTYKISYAGGSAVSMPLTSSGVPVEVKNVSTLSGLTSVDSSIEVVELAANGNAAQGTYSDTITISIVANP